MPHELIRLSDISNLRPNVTAAEIDEMIAKVAVHNIKNGITGVLA